METLLKTPIEKIEYQKRYNTEHADKIRLYQQKYYEAHREERITQQKQRNKENHTHLKEMSSKYAKEHREAINERRRNYGTYDCTCGSLNLLVLNRTTHEKSQKHKKHINIA
jgi:hypothetical protein